MIRPIAEAVSMWDVVFSGGVFGVCIIAVLAAMSIATVFLAVDQILALRRSEIVPAGLSESVRSALATGHVAEADAACRNQPSVLGVCLLTGLAEMDLNFVAVDKAVEDAMSGQAARMMRRIDYLSVIGNIAPMIGLLGTVTGMVSAFSQVAATQGGAGAGELADGIYQALVTTVGGLLVAIPALTIHAVCRNRIDALLSDVAHEATIALGPIRRRAAARPPRK